MMRRFFPSGLAAALLAAAAHADVGPFFEPEQPIFGTQVEIAPRGQVGDAAANFVVRGFALPVPGGVCVAFDQELLRVAAVWDGDAASLVTLEDMAQISYADGRRKAAMAHPRPARPPWLVSRMHPGAGGSPGELLPDPRPPRRPGDEGRGPLPRTQARFEGVALDRQGAELRYRIDGTSVAERFAAVREATATRLTCYFRLAAHARPVLLNLGLAPAGAWSLARPGHPIAGQGGETVTAGSDLPAAVFQMLPTGELMAVMPPSDGPVRVAFTLRHASSGGAGENEPVPLPPAGPAARWPDRLVTAAAGIDVAGNGLEVERVALPENNRWGRRVRVADIAFLTADRAAVLSYDGDIWTVDGFADPGLSRLVWRRFASGLHEPLALIHHGGDLLVATKNGVVRVADRHGSGEADWFGNFNDDLIQSQTTRSFPLDLAAGPDGGVFVTQGGIVDQSGLRSGGRGTAETGAILRIAPDGASSEVFATAAREPFLTVDPVSGRVTATDQQGHFIPSSVCYYVRAGDAFGFPEVAPHRLTPPLVWIPHDQDSSSTSQLWLRGGGFGPWNGRLLHLSYGTGRMFVIDPDFAAPVAQGAIIPLGLETDLPLLHARLHPGGDAAYLCGFQIWGSRVSTMSFLARLRANAGPAHTAVGARSTENGVILQFDSPLDPASVRPERVTVRAWNYRRSADYGSGRYTSAGAPGTDRWGAAQTVLSLDRRSVFVYLPTLLPVMQLEIDHDFRSAAGNAVKGEVYLTIHRLHAADLTAAGFGPIDFGRRDAVIGREMEWPVNPESGHRLAEQFGCIACHSIDGTTAGRVGPTWFRLYGSTVRFADGSSAVADDRYLREKVLNPGLRRIGAGPIEMPSFNGVLSPSQLQSILSYIHSLK